MRVVSVDATAGSFGVELRGKTAATATVVTTEATTFSAQDGTEASFADVAVGAKVTVTGTTATDGTVTATSVVILTDCENPGPGGTITEISADVLAFVIQVKGSTVTVMTDDSTLFLKADGTAGTFVDLTVGSKVAVKGTTAEDGTIAATEVAILEARVCNPTSGSGTVVSVDATALTFVIQPKGSSAATVTVLTTTSTVYVTSKGVAATFADFVAGVKVSVKGTTPGDGTVTAEKVIIEVAKGKKANKKSK